MIERYQANNAYYVVYFKDKDTLILIKTVDVRQILVEDAECPKSSDAAETGETETALQLVKQKQRRAGICGGTGTG
ncbi:MAG: hypothetical protein ACLTDC_10685 [Lachnospiraceae bacterium]